MGILKNNTPASRRLLFFSPWLFGAACLLLLLVLILFTLSNFKRERDHIEGTLEQQGLTLFRFINSTVRESIRDSLRDHDARVAWEDHMRSAMELALEQPGVEQLIIAGDNGVVFLHTGMKSEEPEKGSEKELNENELKAVELLRKQHEKPWSSLIVRDHQAGKKIFLLAAKQRLPMLRGKGVHPGRHRNLIHLPFFPEILKELETIQRQRPVFIAQLDYAQLSKPLRKQFLQILLQLFVITLVGIGGGLSFLTLRGLKQSERNLREVTAFNTSMVSSLTTGLIATDSQNVIQLCNQAGARILGVNEAEIVGKEPKEVLPKQCTDILAEPFSGDKSDSEVNIVIERKEQNRSLHLICSPVFSENGVLLGKVLLVRDMTQIATLERQLRRSERMASLGKMAAGIAHELRNPLSSIKGLALMLRSNFTKDSEEEKNTDTLVREVERLNRGIGELLDYARPGQILKEEINLLDLVSKTMSLVEADARAYGIRMTLTQEGEATQATCDSDKISQVLLNLFLNALQDLEKTVEKGMGKITTLVCQKGRFFKITVRDNGGGIAPELVKKVFDPYFTTKADGTGLGLALSAKIIEDHGGSMEISSDQESGTEVSFFLPVI